MRNKLLITVFIVGMVGFLWPLSSFLIELKNWDVIDEPASVAQLIRCLVFALVAIGAALGIDVKSIITSSPTTVSTQTLDKINNQEKVGV